MIISLLSLALLVFPAISLSIPSTNTFWSEVHTLAANASTLVDISGPLNLCIITINPPLNLKIEDRGIRRESVKFISNKEILEIGFYVDAYGNIDAFCQVETDDHIVLPKLLNSSVTGPKSSLYSSLYADIFIYVHFNNLVTPNMMEISLKLITQPFNLSKNASFDSIAELDFMWKETKAIKNRDIKLQSFSEITREFWIDGNISERVELSSFDLRCDGENEVVTPIQWSFSESIESFWPKNASLPITTGMFQDQIRNSTNFIF